MPRLSKPVLPFRMTEAQYQRAENEFEGRCRACGAVANGLEGDVCASPCPRCRQFQVYGMQELLERGEIEILPARRT